MQEKTSKKQRLNAIVEIISSHPVETQGQLTNYLISRGYDVTQATVSRDIKELRLIKISDRNDKSRYALPGKETGADMCLRYTALLTHAVTSVRHAQNLVVVKTLPGSAQGCAMAIETLELDNIVGVIAGDDTLFIAMNTEREARAFAEKLVSIVG